MSLNIDTEEVKQAWIVCFGDDEGWHPSLASGLFFSYNAAVTYAGNHPDRNNEWCILRVLPFTLEVVNDCFDPENPPKAK